MLEQNSHSRMISAGFCREKQTQIMVFLPPYFMGGMIQSTNHFAKIALELVLFCKLAAVYVHIHVVVKCCMCCRLTYTMLDMLDVGQFPCLHCAHGVVMNEHPLLLG